MSTDSDNQNEVQVVKHKDFTRARLKNVMKKGILNWSDLPNENPDHVAKIDAKRNRASKKDTSSHSNTHIMRKT